jgi:hypothetical protein
MDSSLCVAEHWTVTGERIVLSGDRPTITRVAQFVEVPIDDMVRIGPSRYVLPLWGSALRRYLNHYHDSPMGAV